MYYFRARMYDPNNRFPQPDPIWPADGLNPYPYAGGDPVNWRDPMGTRPTANPPEDQLEADDNPITVTGSRRSFALMGPSTPLRVGSRPTLDFLSGTWDCVLGAPCVFNPTIVVTAPQRPFVARFPVPRPRSRSRQGSIVVSEDWCGSQGFNVPDGAWSQACRAHDQCYAAPGAPKIVCDVVLARNITSECDARTGRSELCPVVSVVYSVGLIIAGYPGLPADRAYRAAQAAGQER